MGKVGVNCTRRVRAPWGTCGTTTVDLVSPCEISRSRGGRQSVVLTIRATRSVLVRIRSRCKEGLVAFGDALEWDQQVEVVRPDVRILGPNARTLAPFHKTLSVAEEAPDSVEITVWL